MRRRFLGLSRLCIAALAAGCSSPLRPSGQDMPAPSEAVSGARLEAPGPRYFHPLDLGNRWLHRQTFVLAPASSSTPFTPIRIGSQYLRDLSCVEDRTGVGYVVEHIEQTDTTAFGPQTAHQWIRYRQDASGLYEADVGLGEAPSCAPPSATQRSPHARRDAIAAAMKQSWRLEDAAVESAATLCAERIESALSLVRAAAPSDGALPGELTRLRYPLTEGTIWIIRPDPLYTATVEALEALRLPIGTVHAWRIRIEAPFYGPHDRVHFWFGRAGMLRMLVHIEIPTDIGTLVADEHQWVEDLSIRRGRF